MTASPNFKALTTSLVWSHQSTKRLSIVQQVKPSPREDQVPPDCLHPGVRAGSFGNSPSTIEHVAMLPCPCSTLLLLWTYVDLPAFFIFFIFISYLWKWWFEWMMARWSQDNMAWWTRRHNDLNGYCADYLMWWKIMGHEPTNEFRLRVFFRRCLLSRSRITTNCRKRLWGSKRPPTWSWALWGSLLTQRLESYWCVGSIWSMRFPCSRWMCLRHGGQKILSNGALGESSFVVLI